MSDCSSQSAEVHAGVLSVVISFFTDIWVPSVSFREEEEDEEVDVV